MIELKNRNRINPNNSSIIQNEFEIIGDNINEIIDFALNRIRPQNKEFYRREIKEDLTKDGSSVISHHAGFGIAYKITLI